LWSAPSAIVLALGSMLVPAVVRRLGRFGVLAAGFALAAVGLLITSRASEGLAVFVIGQIVLYTGLGPLGAVTSDLVLGSAPPEKAGAAAAISETSFELGAALGIAVLGSFSVAVYRSVLTAAPGGVSPAEWDAARATLGGAVATAASLPQAASAEVL